MSEQEHSEKKPGNKTVEVSLGLITVVASFMYIHEQLQVKHLYDVLIAVLVFGVGLIFLYRHFK